MLLELHVARLSLIIENPATGDLIEQAAFGRKYHSA
jgi:hypothetical protein